MDMGRWGTPQLHRSTVRLTAYHQVLWQDKTTTHHLATIYHLAAITHLAQVLATPSLVRVTMGAIPYWDRLRHGLQIFR